MEKQLDAPSFSDPIEIGKDSWNELLQSSCADSIEAATMRPLVLYQNNLKNRFLQASALPHNFDSHSRLAIRQWSLPPNQNSEDPPWHKLDSSNNFGISARENYRFLRSLWSLENTVPNPILLKNPWIQTFQPAQAIASLLAKKWNCQFPPLSLQQFSSGAAFFSNRASDPENPLPTLAEQCQLALLWLVNGFENEAKKLIRWLIPLADVPFLWCPEKEFDEDETLLSYSLLFRTIGDEEKANRFLKTVQKPVDLFFLQLARMVPRIEGIDSNERMIEDPCLGLKLIKNNQSVAAFTLTGIGSSLGMVRANDVTIQAFGPQPLPLSDGHPFGISFFPDGNPLHGWTRCLAQPEVWIGMKNEGGTRIHLKFLGLTPQEPLAIVFYVKSQSCQIGNSLYKPKSLNRYAGETNYLVLNGKKGGLKIESSLSHKVQVIPLAGEGSFWNADFLISFEIHPVAAAASFLFSPF